MDIDTVKKIQSTAYKFFVAITGGGQSFIGDYTRISGASNNFLGAFVPYNQELFNRFVGGAPDNYASPEAARKLAVASYFECLKAGTPVELAIGIGAASSVVKENEREGRQHKIHVAVHRYNLTGEINLILNQGRIRLEEDAIVNQLILNGLSITTGNYIRPFTNIEHSKEEIADTKYTHGEPFSNILSGQVDYLSNHYKLEHKLGDIALYGGSFNPCHDGHRQIREMAEKILKTSVLFELTCRNADKGSLDYIDLEKRLKDIRSYPYILTTVATIKEKVDLIRKYNKNAPITFVVGADTWIRIWDAKYGYAPEFLETFFKQNNVKFLVFGRNKIDINLPFGHTLRVKSEEAENVTFSYSSTDIRKKLNNK